MKINGLLVVFIILLSTNFVFGGAVTPPIKSQFITYSDDNTLSFIYNQLDSKLDKVEVMKVFYKEIYGDIGVEVLTDGVNALLERGVNVEDAYVHVFMATVDQESNFYYTKSLKINKNKTTDHGYTQVNDIHFYSTKSRVRYFDEDKRDTNPEILKKDIRAITEAGSRILYSNKDQFKSYYNALVVYNAGSGRFQRGTVPTHTYDYASKILKNANNTGHAFNLFYDEYNTMYNLNIIQQEVIHSKDNHTNKFKLDDIEQTIDIMRTSSNDKQVPIEVPTNDGDEVFVFIIEFSSMNREELLESLLQTIYFEYIQGEFTNVKTE